MSHRSDDESRCVQSKAATGVLVQVVGTHNSYHLAPPQAIQDLAYNPLVDAVAADYAQSAVNTTQYDQLSLYEQLDIGQQSCSCCMLYMYASLLAVGLSALTAFGYTASYAVQSAVAIGPHSCKVGLSWPLIMQVSGVLR